MVSFYLKQNAGNIRADIPEALVGNSVGIAGNEPR